MDFFLKMVPDIIRFRSKLGKTGPLDGFGGWRVGEVGRLGPLDCFGGCSVGEVGSEEVD